MSSIRLHKLYNIFLIPVCILSIGFTIHSDMPIAVQAILETEQTTFEAGESIGLSFLLNKSVKTQLYCHTAYGVTILAPIIIGHKTIYNLPNYIAYKKGILDYTLLYDQKILYESRISILPSHNLKNEIESYVGPPSIIAGGRDYTMFVAVPTDVYDNPLVDRTAVVIKHQFLDKQKEEELVIDTGIAWKNIFSYPQSGRLLLAAEVAGITSSEFAVEVYPAHATDFEISYQRKHVYADGNQITIFTTSMIKDVYGNVVSDGTLVSFRIKNKKGVVLKTTATTINGVAKGKMLHPDQTEQWEVTGYVIGMGTSNTIQLTYKSVIEDYEVRIEDDNRIIKVGPIKSFMNQIIPDGAVVKLTIISESKPVETILKTTRKGKVVFTLTTGFYEKGVYTFILDVFGIKKKYKAIQL